MYEQSKKKHGGRKRIGKEKASAHSHKNLSKCANNKSNIGFYFKAIAAGEVLPEEYICRPSDPMKNCVNMSKLRHIFNRFGCIRKCNPKWRLKCATCKSCCQQYGKCRCCDALTDPDADGGRSKLFALLAKFPKPTPSEMELSVTESDIQNLLMGDLAAAPAGTGAEEELYGVGGIGALGGPKGPGVLGGPGGPSGPGGPGGSGGPGGLTGAGGPSGPCVPECIVPSSGITCLPTCKKRNSNLCTVTPGCQAANTEKCKCVRNSGASLTCGPRKVTKRKELNCEKVPGCNKKSPQNVSDLCKCPGSGPPKANVKPKASAGGCGRDDKAAAGKGKKPSTTMASKPRSASLSKPCGDGPAEKSGCFSSAPPSRSRSLVKNERTKNVSCGAGEKRDQSTNFEGPDINLNIIIQHCNANDSLVKMTPVRDEDCNCQVGNFTATINTALGVPTFQGPNNAICTTFGKDRIEFELPLVEKKHSTEKLCYPDSFDLNQTDKYALEAALKKFAVSLT